MLNISVITVSTILFYNNHTIGTAPLEESLLAGTIMLIMLLIFVPIMYIIYKARTNELVLEDGIEDKIDSPPKYCMEEQPPTYEEAIKIEIIL